MVIITKFTTTTTDEDILKNTDIQKRICDVLGKTADEYTLLLAHDGLKVDFTIFFSAINKISINNGLYNDLIEDTVYTSGGHVLVKSIKIKTATTATLMIELG